MLKNILRDLYPSLTKVSDDSVTLNWLLNIGVPTDIVDDLRHVSQPGLEIGNFDLFEFEKLHKQNNDPNYALWFRKDYLTIAQGLNGDPVVFDIRTSLIGFVDHTEMDYKNIELIPEEHVIHTPLSYDQFWNDGIQGYDDETGESTFPFDSVFAEKVWGKHVRGHFH